MIFQVSPLQPFVHISSGIQMLRCGVERLSFLKLVNSCFLICLLETLAAEACWVCVKPMGTNIPHITGELKTVDWCIRTTKLINNIKSRRVRFLPHTHTDVQHWKSFLSLCVKDKWVLKGHVSRKWMVTLNSSHSTSLLSDVVIAPCDVCALSLGM